VRFTLNEPFPAETFVAAIRQRVDRLPLPSISRNWLS